VLGATPADDALADLDAQVAALQSSLRRVLQSIRPQPLEDAALSDALANLTDEMERRSGLRCRFEAHNASAQLSAPVSVALFRIAQEAVTNAVRHARARSVVVRLEVGSRVVTLTVRDDGQGFDPARLGRGFGTQNIVERAGALGGSARWSFDAGTTVHVELPVEG
jgi:signal transduction histidine kinase